MNNTVKPNLDLIQSTMIPTTLEPTTRPIMTNTVKPDLNLIQSTGIQSTMISRTMEPTPQIINQKLIKETIVTLIPGKLSSTINPEIMKQTTATIVPLTIIPEITNKTIIRSSDKHYMGYDGTTLATTSQNYNDNIESIFPEVKEVRLVDLIDIKPYDESVMGQMAHTLELNITNEKKTFKPTHKLSGIKELTETEIIYSGVSVDPDNLRGEYSGFSKESSFMNYKRFMQD